VVFALELGAIGTLLAPTWFTFVWLELQVPKEPNRERGCSACVGMRRRKRGAVIAGWKSARSGISARRDCANARGAARGRKEAIERAF